MSGVAVIRFLLANDAAVLAKVAADNIFAGDAPIGAVLPVISVKQISGMPYLTIAMNESKYLHTERVQVTPLLKGPDASPAGDGYPGVKALLALALAACKNVHGIVNGIDVDSILPDLEGPDLSDNALSLYTQSRDFIVKFNA